MRTLCHQVFHVKIARRDDRAHGVTLFAPRTRPAQGWRQKQICGTADQFITLISKQVRRRRVDHLDRPLVIDRQDAVGNGLHHRSQANFACPHTFLRPQFI